VIFDAGDGMKIIEEMSQGRGVDQCNRSHGKVCRGGPNELGHISGKSFSDRLHRSLGERHRISLFLTSHPDHTSWARRSLAITSV
jgi:hypothetical protein